MYCALKIGLLEFLFVGFQNSHPRENLLLQDHGMWPPRAYITGVGCDVSERQRMKKVERQMWKTPVRKRS